MQEHQKESKRGTWNLFHDTIDLIVVFKIDVFWIVKITVSKYEHFWKYRVI